MWFNDEYKHAGSLWEGRFYSGVVEKDAVVKAVVAAYIGYNPVKAKVVAAPEQWRWSSYALAVSDGGSDGERCRQMYERMLGRPWEEVRATLESMYADKLPDSRGGGQTPRFCFNLHLLRLEAPPLSAVCDSDVIFGLLFRVVRHLVP